MRKQFIAVLGTDGSGKSTLLNAIVPLIEKKMSGKVVVHHLRPDLLPPLGRFRGVRHEPGYVCVNPHGSKPSGFAGSLFRLTYLVCDYILGYWFKVRPMLRRKEIACWVFDRYAYDILIDPLRFRIKLPRWIIRLYLKIVPRPNIVLCLGGDPEKIFARKPETSLEEVSRQMIELEKLSEGLPNARMIDTTVSIEDTIAAAMNALEGLRHGQ
jgi:thymidylate kinase